MDSKIENPANMDQNIDRTIAAYLNLIRTRYSGIVKVYLFGSYAKCKFTEDSDIDLALIFNELDDANRFDTQVQLMLLASQIDSRIEPHPISKVDFNSGNPFVTEIRRTGIEVAA